MADWHPPQTLVRPRSAECYLSSSRAHGQRMAPSLRFALHSRPSSLLPSAAAQGWAATRRCRLRHGRRQRGHVSALQPRDWPVRVGRLTILQTESTPPHRRSHRHGDARSERTSSAPTPTFRTRRRPPRARCPVSPSRFTAVDKDLEELLTGDPTKLTEPIKTTKARAQPPSSLAQPRGRAGARTARSGATHPSAQRAADAPNNTFLLSSCHPATTGQVRPAPGLPQGPRPRPAAHRLVQLPRGGRGARARVEPRTMSSSLLQRIHPPQRNHAHALFPPRFHPRQPPPPTTRCGRSSRPRRTRR